MTFRSWVLAAVAVAAAAGVAMFASSYYVTVASFVLLYATVALGLTLMTGFAGLISFGQAAFVLASRCVWPFRTTGRSDRGVLRLLAGPHRVEGGCCDRTTSIEAVKKRAASPTVPPLETTSHVAQDDWVVVSEQAGVL